MSDSQSGQKPSAGSKPPKLPKVNDKLDALAHIGESASASSKNRYSRRRNNSTGPLIVVVMVLLAICSAVGGYLVWGPDPETVTEKPTETSQEPEPTGQIKPTGSQASRASDNASQPDGPSDPSDRDTSLAQNVQPDSEHNERSKPIEDDPVFDASLLDEDSSYQAPDNDGLSSGPSSFPDGASSDDSVNTDGPMTDDSADVKLIDDDPVFDASMLEDPEFDAANSVLPGSDDDPNDGPMIESRPGDDLLYDLYERGKLLHKSSYPAIRGVFAARFAEQYQSQIDESLGPLEPVEEGSVRQWLEQNPAVRDELYLAIDPSHDKIEGVFALFKQMYDLDPDLFEDFSTLAIAIAVVWDNPRGANHTSPTGQHKSVPPKDKLDAIGNYKYFVSAHDAMGPRITYLPWEFITFMVNHDTTLVERKWALSNYLPKRAMIGKCYGDVPYDGPMLSGEAPPRISGKEHSLPNMLQFGGVCSCQSDYATRVTKSLGVPGFGAAGENRYGSRHAWVMWVELKNITPTGFNFSLESHGRYRGDHYYVGSTKHPQAGTNTTDREMERYLRSVAGDPIANRQATLVMRVLPMIYEREELDVRDKLNLLERVIAMSPANREPWIALGEMARYDEIDASFRAPMGRALDQLMLTFREFPDFTWEMFETLISWEEDPKQRFAMFARLTTMYESAGRPDLACEAWLWFASEMADRDETADAMKGLAGLAMKHPKEGHIITDVLDRMDSLCETLDESTQQAGQAYLARFYLEFTPKVPERRGSAVSSYCTKTYRRAIGHMQAAGMDGPAQMFEMKLRQLEAE